MTLRSLVKALSWVFARASSPVFPTLVALLSCLWRLGSQSLWADEGETIGIALSGLGAYEHPPGYFRFIGLWLKIVGSSEFALRLPSALSVAGLAFLAAEVARLLGLARASGWAAWLVALSPFVRVGGQEARMYAPLALTQAVALLGLLRHVRGLWGGAWLWALGTAASAAMHHIGWLACWPPWGLVLLRSRRRHPLVWAGILALALYAPLFAPTTSQVMMRLRGGHMSSSPSAAAAVKKLVGHAFYVGAGYALSGLGSQSFGDFVRSSKGVLFFAQLVVPGLILVRGLREVATCWPGGGLLLGAFAMPTVLFLAYEGSPANMLLPVFVAYACVFAAGVRVTPRGVVLVLMLVWLPSHVRHGTSPGYVLHPEDWRGATALIRASASPEDAVFLTGSRNSLFVTDYYRVDPAVRYTLVDSVRAVSSLDPHLARPDRSVVRELEAILARHPRVWLVYLDWDVPFMERSLDTLWHAYGRWRAHFGDGLELLRLER